jgi:ribosomal protein S15P/S13E
MTNSEIQKKLNLIREIEPNKKWVSETRSVLFLEINKDRKEENVTTWKQNWQKIKTGFGFSLDTLLPSHFMNTFGRPAVISFFGVGVIVSSMASIGFAQEAVPGGLLYPVKIAGEKIQLSLIASDQEKAKLEMDFAGRRIKEINQLMATNAFTPEQLEIKIKETTTNLQRNINTVKGHLNELNKDKESKTALAVAREIDTKVSEYTQKLNSVSKSTVKSKQMTEMLDQVSQVGDKTLEIMIAKHNPEDTTVSDLEIVEKLNNKIALVENSTTGTEAGQVVSEAKDLIKNGDFAAALVKITESKDIIAKLKEEMEKQKAIDTANIANNVETQNLASTPEVVPVIEKVEKVE